MTQTNNSFSGEASASGVDSPGAVARILWIFLILATLYLCYFHELGAVGLVGPDEPRYASIARDMAQSADWVTPKLYGQPWFEKPVLYYWGAAVSFRRFGASDAAARLPSAFCALLATLSLAWLARKLYGAETANLLLVLLPATVGMIGFSHAAATDMPFSGMLTVAMVFAATIVRLTTDGNSPILPRTPWLSLIFFGFFLGLAVLAKGPAAILISGCSVLLWAAFTTRWRDAFYCLHPVAVISFCATALPWFVLCARRNPEFLRVFIIEHNFKRFLTPEFQHLQPLWYYLPVLLLAVFPFVFFLPATIKDAIASWGPAGTRPTTLFFACWALFTVIFFSLSKSKLPGYILPAVPAMMLLVARSLNRLLDEGKKSSRWMFLITGMVFVLIGLALERTSGRIPAMQCVSPICGITRIWLVAVIGGLVIAILGGIGALRFSFLAMVLTPLLLVVEIDRFLPNLDPGVSARVPASDVKNVWPEFSPQQAATWQLDRQYVYQLNYYLRADLMEWKNESAKPEWLFVNKEKRQAVEQLGFHCVNYAIDPVVLPCRGIPLLRGSNGLAAGGSHTDRGDRQLR